MKPTNEQKIIVINYIDQLESITPFIDYKKKLRAMRAKYIYKDISFDEIRNDGKWLQDLKNNLKSL